MPLPRRDSTERTLADLWNGRSSFERLKMILGHPDLFLSQCLVTPDELARATAVSETEIEYLLEREPHTIFSNLQLENKIETQKHRHQIMTALQAVVL